MRLAYVTDEVWSFDCRRCGHRWRETYEARHAQDPDGGEVCLWQRRGHPCAAPQAGLPCPRCGGLRVRASTVTRR